MLERRDVIKHSAAVHITNKPTLVGRQIWNICVGKARPHMGKRETHEIKLSEIMDCLGWGGHNQDYVKDSLRALVSCTVEWNILGKDKINEWGVTSLLSQAVIRDGICQYAFSPKLAERLRLSNMYTKLNLAIQAQIDSKYAQALWELCLDALDESRGEGETPPITMEIFRKLMGVPEGSYLEFKKFNQWIIKPAIKVVNEVTDFEVTPEFFHQRRQVIAVKFRVKRIQGKAQQARLQPDLFPAEKDTPQVVQELKVAGMESGTAWHIHQEGFKYIAPDKRPNITDYDQDPDRALLKYVREKIDLKNRRKADGKLKNEAGFLHDAIKKNYQNPEMVAEAQQTAARSKAKEADARLRRRDHLKYKREDLKKEKGIALKEICNQYVEEFPEMVDKAVALLLHSNAGFRKSYSDKKSALENYHARPMVWVLVDQWLMENYPEKFRAVNQEYDAQLADIDREIAEMTQSVKVAA
jgi:hypothetical protein